MGQERIAAALLEHKADAHVANVDGETALHLAAWCENVFLIRHLIVSGGDPFRRDNDLHVPLLCCEEANARAALMDSCWQRLTFEDALLFLVRMFWIFLQANQLAPLCRRPRRRVMFLETSDSFGGSAADGSQPSSPHVSKTFIA